MCARVCGCYTALGPAGQAGAVRGERGWAVLPPAARGAPGTAALTNRAHQPPRRPWVCLGCPQDWHCTVRGAPKALPLRSRAGLGKEQERLSAGPALEKLGAAWVARLRAQPLVQPWAWLPGLLCPAPPSQMYSSLCLAPVVCVSTFHNTFCGADGLCGCSDLMTQLGEVSHGDFHIPCADQVLSILPALCACLSKCWCCVHQWTSMCRVQHFPTFWLFLPGCRSDTKPNPAGCSRSPCPGPSGGSGSLYNPGSPCCLLFTLPECCPVK